MPGGRFILGNVGICAAAGRSGFTGTNAIQGFCVGRAVRHGADDTDKKRFTAFRQYFRLLVGRGLGGRLYAMEPGDSVCFGRVAGRAFGRCPTWLYYRAANGGLFRHACATRRGSGYRHLRFSVLHGSRLRH